PEGDALDQIDRQTGVGQHPARGQIDPDVHQFGDVERAHRYADDLYRQQESQATGHGIDHELERRVLPVLAAPYLDQEVHRDEAEFPEDEEDNQVERGEQAQHG